MGIMESDSNAIELLQQSAPRPETTRNRELVFICIRRVCLLRYISYGARRMSKQRTFKLLPEFAKIAEKFCNRSLPNWRGKMWSHNQTLSRGQRMGLCPHFDASKLLCPTLDRYMIQMHAADISEALKSLTVFGERVAPLIRKNPADPTWWITRDLLIHRRHWYSLCRNAMNLIRLTGIDADDHVAPLLHRWPDCDALHVAARAAASIFGHFSDPDIDCPPLRLLLARSAATSRAAGPGRRRIRPRPVGG